MLGRLRLVKRIEGSVQFKGLSDLQAANQHCRLASTEGQAAVEETAPAGSHSSSSWSRIPVFGAVGALTGFGTAYALSERIAPPLPGLQTPNSSVMAVDWVQRLAAEEGKELVLSAESMHTHPLLKKDHMFSNLHQHQMVQDLMCFYDPSNQRLEYVIQLGRNVCGFPSIMHGGLTAAILDECFGFLWISLRANKQLTFSGIAFTAHLEVDYKQKIPAGRLLLCTTEVESCEGRKLWMRAEVRDGPSGKVYATARALFVRPRTQRLIREGLNIAYSYFRS